MVVYISEEYGYRHWEWKTNLSEKELIEWWENLETVSTFFFDPGKTLPFGIAKEIEDDDYDYQSDYGMHLHTDGDSHLLVRATRHLHKGHDPYYYFPEDRPTDDQSKERE